MPYKALSYALLVLSIVMFLNPIIGIFAAMTVVLIQVSRGIRLSKRFIAAGIILIFLHVILIIINQAVQQSILEIGKPSGTDPDDPNEGIEVNPDVPGEVPFKIDWAMVAVILGVLTSVMGWYMSKKQRKETLRLINEIDHLYNLSKTNPAESYEKLTGIKEHLKKEFAENKIDEANFHLLYKMADRDLGEIKAQTGQTIA